MYVTGSGSQGTSRFLPRLLGVWLITGCFGWLAVSLTGLLLPGHEDKVFTIVQPFTFGEVPIMLWLAVMGAKTSVGRRNPVVVGLGCCFMAAMLVLARKFFPATTSG